MRKHFVPAVSALVGVVLITTAAFGRTEEKFNSGACEPPDARIETWWSITTYVNGVPTKVSGRDCQGNLYWDRPINIRFVSTDPISGMTPTNSGMDDNGTMWAAVIIYNDDHDPIWMGGRTGSGAYWVV